MLELHTILFRLVCVGILITNIWNHLVEWIGVICSGVRLCCVCVCMCESARAHVSFVYARRFRVDAFQRNSNLIGRGGFKRVTARQPDTAVQCIFCC